MVCLSLNKFGRFTLVWFTIESVSGVGIFGGTTKKGGGYFGKWGIEAKIQL